MNFKLKITAAAILAASLIASCGYASDATPPAKKHSATKKAKTPPAPTVEEQIQALRQELEGQINGLKTDLSDKDAQLKKAQQAAADAQAAADKAQAAATAQQQAVGDNAAAVTTLQTTVTDMKGAETSLATSISDETSKSAKKSELSELAFGKVKIGATVFADFSYWSDYDGSTAFVDNQTTPSSIKDQNYNTFELTRTYLNLYYTPNDAVTLRITPDIYRNTDATSVSSTTRCTANTATPPVITCTTTNTTTPDNSLSFRLKYGYIDLNKLFAGNEYLKDTKITFGQMQSPLVPWEEDLNGHRYTYKVPLDFSGGLSSAYVGVKAHGPVKFNGKEYLDYDLGIFTNGKYSVAELSGTKQFMGRTSWYPMGTKTDRTGLGLTIFGNYGFSNVAPSSAASGQYPMDRTVIMGHYQTADKGYLITGQYDLSHNVKTKGVTQEGYAFEGNARLGGAKSPFHAFGIYQYYEPNSNASTNNATKYSRTVGGIAFKFNKNLDIAVGDSNLHYLNSTAAGKNDANAASIFTQYIF
jgi:hypothetical protein